MARQSPIPQGGGVFAKMDFPDFVFQEYPKIVDAPHGRVVVNNQREELELAATRGIGAEPTPAERERDQMAAQLTAQADELEQLRAKLAEMAGGPTLSPDEIAKGQAVASAVVVEATPAQLIAGLTKTGKK